jgi:hypothetical protein
MEESRNGGLPVFSEACGVVAGRLSIDLDTAARILERVARRGKVSVDELAAAVVASCSDSTVFLPRALYTNGGDYESAA